jgi:putative endonuclease
MSERRGASVYVVECVDGSLYCGFAFDVPARVRTHNDGCGARFTRSRRPVRLRWVWQARRAEDARRLEGLIKRLSRAQKLRLVAHDVAVLGPLLLEVARRRR